MVLRFVCAVMDAGACLLEFDQNLTAMRHAPCGRQTIASLNRARWGDNVASNKLADCYREGRGVKKDFIGMIAMAGISEKQGGISMDAYFKSLPKDDEYRRIYEIVDLISRHHQEPADSIIGKMDKQNNPDLVILNL
jgi:hypothetical protein